MNKTTSLNIKQRLLTLPGHTKPPDSSPEGAESPSEKDSPEPPPLENRDLKSPRQDPYLHSTNMPEGMPPMPPAVHEMPPPMYGNDDGRILQQPFPFPSMLMNAQMDNGDIVPTDLRVMSKNCPCAVPEVDEPQNLAYRPRREKESDSESDTEIDLTSHSSKDDDLRDSERLANRIATSIFRSDTVLHELVPNDLSLGAIKNGSDRNVANRTNLSI